jgi:hypothetical protein
MKSRYHAARGRLYLDRPGPYDADRDGTVKAVAKRHALSPWLVHRILLAAETPAPPARRIAGG